MMRCLFSTQLSRRFAHPSSVVAVAVAALLEATVALLVLVVLLAVQDAPSSQAMASCAVGNRSPV